MNFETPFILKALQRTGIVEPRQYPEDTPAFLPVERIPNIWKRATKQLNSSMLVDIEK